jgi:hypothetical protein
MVMNDEDSTSKLVPDCLAALDELSLVQRRILVAADEVARHGVHDDEIRTRSPRQLGPHRFDPALSF